MKSSYNPQEEINELSVRVQELTDLLNDKVAELTQAIQAIRNELLKVNIKVDQSDKTQRRMDLRVEDLQGTLAQKLRTLGQITKWDKK